MLSLNDVRKILSADAVRDATDADLSAIEQTGFFSRKLAEMTAARVTGQVMTAKPGDGELPAVPKIAA